MRGAFFVRGPVHRSPKALPLGTVPAPYAMPSPSLFDFLRDAESWRGMRQGLTDAANRGMVAGTLGAPVDMATQAANLGIAGVGYLGHKTGLLSTPPELLDSRNVPGSSEWIGQKMQNSGMVTENRNPIAEAGMGLLSPVAFKAAQKAGGLLAGAEMKAAENAAKPSAIRMQAQRGVARIGGMANDTVDDVISPWVNQGVKVDVLEARSRPTLTLSRIVVPDGRRGSGVGSQVMNDLIRYADGNGKTITLNPSTEFGGTSVARLKEFYKRFGFVENKGRTKDYEISESMYRPPIKRAD